MTLDIQISSTLEVGRTRRLAHLFADDGRALVVGYDHSVSVGTASGALSALPQLARQSFDGGVDALQMGVQSIRSLERAVVASPQVGLVLRIDQSICNDDRQQLLPPPTLWATPTQVLQAAGDAAVVYYVHDTRDPGVGASHAVMIGRVAEECARIGLPLMVEVMVKTETESHGAISTTMIDAARIGFELGADLIKIDRTPDRRAMDDLVDAVPVPVLLRGGPPADTFADTIADLERSLEAGVVGAVYGRTVWQNGNPERATRDLSSVIHGH